MRKKHFMGMPYINMETLKRYLAEYPPESIHFRNLGGYKVEMISIVKGSITRLGYIELPRESDNAKV